MLSSKHNHQVIIYGKLTHFMPTPAISLSIMTLAQLVSVYFFIELILGSCMPPLLYMQVVTCRFVNYMYFTGSAAVGKTSILLRHCKNEFHTTLKSTFPIDLLETAVPMEDGRQLRVWTATNNDTHTHTHTHTQHTHNTHTQWPPYLNWKEMFTCLVPKCSSFLGSVPQVSTDLFYLSRSVPTIISSMSSTNCSVCING